MQPSFLKRIRYLLEYLLIKVGFAFFRLLPLPVASNLGGWIARTLGPHVKVSRKAKNNMRMAFPEWTKEQINQAVYDMWDNLGRYATELPHFAKMPPEKFFEICELVGEEHLQEAAALEGGSLFFSAHMGNWELGAKATHDAGVPLSVVYRPLNNPMVDKIANWHRNHYQTKGVPKTSAGGRDLLKTIRDGGRIAILIDQKMRTGIPVRFFGHDAMTTTSLADLALKYKCPIYPVRVERLEKGPKFRVTVHPPMEYAVTGDAKEDAHTIMREAHGYLEEWIAERPEQWLWLHKRWG